MQTLKVITTRPEIAAAYYRETERLATFGEEIVSDWFPCETPPTLTGFYQLKMNCYKQPGPIHAVLWDGDQYVRPGTHEPFRILEGDQWRGLVRRINDYA